MIPQVKSETYFGDVCRFPQVLCITAGEYGEQAAKLMKLFTPLCSCVCKPEAAIIQAQKSPQYTALPEHYTLEIRDDRVSIWYGDYLGLRNALSCFSLLLQFTGNAFTAPACRIEDFPDAAYRGAMLDIAWGVPPLAQLENDIILLGRARMNYLHLHLMDSVGICFQAETLPSEMYIPHAYTKAQLRRIQALAQLVGVEIIPELDIPAHAKKLLEVFPRLKCVVNGPRQSRTNRWALCAGNEEVYTLLEPLIQETMELFPGKYFHMGGDELEFGDFPHGQDLCFYDDCERCKALKAREGLSDRLDVYYYLVRRIHRIVTRAGRTLLMWSDQLDCTRENPLPQDIIMQFWRVAATGRGPHDGCSMNGQLAMGYRMINSFYEETYCEDEYGFKPRQFQFWDWRREPACSPDYFSQLWGSEVCAWGYGRTNDYPHFAWTLCSYVYLMADKLWNSSASRYGEDYSKILTKAIFGAGTPENLDVFFCYGDLVAPKGDIYITAISTPAGAGDILHTILQLKQKLICAAGDAARAESHLRVLERLYHWYDPSYPCPE